MFAIGVDTTSVLARDQFQEELHQTHRLAPDGRIELSNVNGKIVVNGWDGDEVKIDAVKRADREEDLGAVKIEIDPEVGRLSIKTKYPDSRSGWLKSKRNTTVVDYTLTVPRQVRLDKVSNVNGSIEVEGVRGEVNLSTVNGSLSAEGLVSETSISSVNGKVEAVLERLDTVKSVTISTVNGKASVTIPQSSDAEVSASTVNGSITADQPLTVKKHWPVGRELSGTLGTGGTRIKLSTVNGAIAVRLAGNGRRPAAEADR